MSISHTDNKISNNFGNPFTPDDLRYLQETRQNSAQTPSWVISFGADIDTGNNLAVLDNCVYLWQHRNGFETPTLGLLSQNLHRSGATIATPMWCIIVNSPVSVNLLKFLHKGAIDQITMCNLGMLDNTSQPVVTEKKIFTSCYITNVITDGSDFTIFAFLYCTFKWEHAFYNTLGSGGKNAITAAGQTVYEFDYTFGQGK